MTYTDIMIDLETLGLSFGAPIIQIGAVAFNIEDTKELGTLFSADVVMEGVAEMAAIEWWMMQSDAARKSVFGLQDQYKVTLNHALQLLIEFCSECRSPGTRIWSHGSSFDIAMLSHKFKESNLPIPWDYRNVRDTRTLIELSGTPKPIRGGVHHNALDDAVYQTGWIKECWADVKAGRL